MATIICCRGCKERHIGCHAECESYKAQKQEIEAEKKDKRKEKELDELRSDFRMRYQYYKQHRH